LIRGEGLMQWLHASWGVGVTIGPILMRLGLTALNSWRFGYRVVGGFQLALAVCFVLTLAMWTQHQNSMPSGDEEEKRLTDYRTPMAETLRRPQVSLSILLFFLYVGAESSLGTWTYTLLTESRRVDQTLAGFFAGSYWFSFIVCSPPGLGVDHRSDERAKDGRVDGQILDPDHLVQQEQPNHTDDLGEDEADHKPAG
jgi:fucose permease